MDSPFPPRSWDGIDDVVIVGGGLAGLYCALKLSPRPVTIVAAAPLGEDASPAAQTGLAAALGFGDSADEHVADSLSAGARLADARMVRQMASEAAERVADLLGYGVPFDRELDGALKLTRAGVHSRPRVLRVVGRAAGKAMKAALVAAVRRTPSIRLLECFLAEQLRAEGQYVTGLVVRDRRGGLSDRALIPTRAVVLASGGIGHLYALTTNSPDARGEGIAVAARAGAVIADPEFVQFHPTALDVGLDPAPRASDRLREVGAVIIDRAGRPILPERPDGEALPRSAVARAVQEARASGRGAFLDCRAVVREDLAERFPEFDRACRDAGLDPGRQPVPIAPAAHFHLGGIHVDGSGRTTLDGLWACGEAASTGVHGAEGLASNAILEAVVFAGRAAEDIHGQLPNHRVTRWLDLPAGNLPIYPEQDDKALQRLRATMSGKVGVLRDRAGLVEALAEFEEIGSRVRGPRARNAFAVAKLIAAAALARAESRGAHFRSDHPQPRTEAARTFIRLAAAEHAARSAAGLDRADLALASSAAGTSFSG